MLIERTGLWNKFGFGTQWNLRDIMRHKSRTLMSLIGIVGCMLIIVCAMGMQDTMDAYLDLYYDGATNYASRIYLAEDATMAQREALTEKYKGDWSASVSVQMGEKAISLDIYDVENDKVRFLDEDTNYIDLKDDGAYLCMRMADEFGLKVGDEFTIDVYKRQVSAYRLLGNPWAYDGRKVKIEAYLGSEGVLYINKEEYNTGKLLQIEYLNEKDILELSEEKEAPKVWEEAFQEYKKYGIENPYALSVGAIGSKARLYMENMFYMYSSRRDEAGQKYEKINYEYQCRKIRIHEKDFEAVKEKIGEYEAQGIKFDWE